LWFKTDELGISPDYWTFRRLKWKNAEMGKRQIGILNGNRLASLRRKDGQEKSFVTDKEMLKNV